MDLFTSANPGYQQKINFELSFLQSNSPLAQMHFNAFFSLVFDEFDAANPFFAGLGETDPTDDAGTICQAEPPVAHAEVLALNCNSEVATTSGGLENAAEGDATGRLPSVHGANLFPPNWTVPVHIPGVLPDSIFQNFPPPPPNLPPSSADNWKLAGIQHQQAAPSTVVSTSSPYEVSSLGVGRSPRTRTPCKCPVCEKGEFTSCASRQ